MKSERSWGRLGMKSEWNTVKAKDFCYTVTDGTHDSPKAKENGHYLITSKHLAPYNIDFSSAKKISEEDYQKVIKRSPVEQWDILFSMIGTIGITYLEKNIDIDYACKNMGIFKFNGDMDKAYWLYYYLQTPQAKEYILGHLRGTTQQYLPLGSLRELTIQVPPTDVRNKITSILRNIDDKIELNTKINENLEQQAQAICKSWFVDFEPFGGVKPDDWKSANLLDIADYINGLAMQKYRPVNDEVGLPVLKIKELRQGFCDDNSELCSPNIKGDYIVQDGDVIFSWSGSLLVDFWCGGKCGLNQHLFKVSSKSFDKWFYYIWTKYHLNRFIAIAADMATTMGHIKRSELEKSLVLIPNETDYVEIGNLLKPIYETIIINRIENQRLATLRDTLLPKLMNGEIDVSKVRI